MKHTRTRYNVQVLYRLNTEYTRLATSTGETGDRVPVYEQYLSLPVQVLVVLTQVPKRQSRTWISTP